MNENVSYTKRPIMRANKLFTAGIITVLIVAVCYGFTAHTIKGEGKIEKRNYSVQDFHKIDLGFNADVYFEQNASTKVSIETDENLFEYIKVSVENNTLKLLKKKNTNLKATKGINIYVFSPELTGLYIRGSGTIHLNETVQSSQLACEIDGSGSILAKEIQATSSTFEINGSGDIKVQNWKGSSYDIAINGSGDVHLSQGKAASGKIEVNGSGEVITDGIECRKARVEIAGSGDVQLHATEVLDIEVAGSGDVSYKGQPKVTKHILGSGDVYPIR